MKSEKSQLIMGAIAGLILMGGNAIAETKAAPAAQADEQVSCYGVNSCKGQGSCHGKVDSCSGKNKCSTEVSCAGSNSCKGKGFTKMSKKDCTAKGGKLAEK